MEVNKTSGSQAAAQPTPATKVIAAPDVKKMDPNPAAAEPGSMEPHPFDPLWANLTAEDLPAPPQFSPEEASQVAEFVPKVLAHYAEHRPDPASFPALAVRIVRMSHESDLEVKDLLRTVSMDPAISMHILRVANSALYRRDQEIQDLRRAVLHIGMRESVNVASAVAARSLFELKPNAKDRSFSVLQSKLFVDTMAVAFGASAFTYEQPVGRAEYAFLSGMFHDIGKSIALRSLASLVSEGRVPPPLSDGVVEEVLERVHIEIGGDLHLLWELPEYLTRVCLRHHDFEVPVGAEFWDIHILRLVEGFYRLLRDPGHGRGLNETRQSLQALGLNYASALRLHTIMQAQMERMQLLFGV